MEDVAERYPVKRLLSVGSYCGLKDVYAVSAANWHDLLVIWSYCSSNHNCDCSLFVHSDCTLLSFASSGLDEPGYRLEACWCGRVEGLLGDVSLLNMIAEHSMDLQETYMLADRGDDIHIHLAAYRVGFPVPLPPHQVVT